MEFPMQPSPAWNLCPSFCLSVLSAGIVGIILPPSQYTAFLNLFGHVSKLTSLCFPQFLPHFRGSLFSMPLAQRIKKKKKKVFVGLER